MLITGEDRNGNKIAKLYTNDGTGNFTEKTTGTPFTGVDESSIAFADVDGDDDPDVFIRGNAGTSSEPNFIAKLYTNDGAGNFTEKVVMPFKGLLLSSIAFADVDGDNDQDVLITGFSSSGRITKLYTNDGSGNFIEKTTGTPFTGVRNSSIAFADVDGDNDQDVLITGEDSRSNGIARLYTNDGKGNFTEKAGTPFEGIRFSSIAFADVDGDKDHDVLITGVRRDDEGNFIRITKLYTNDGSGSFTEKIRTPFEGVSRSSIAFADVDGDNDQDVLITGSEYNRNTDRFNRIAKLYTNDGSGSFTEKTGTLFPGVDNSSIALADVDGDKDQDVLITGFSSSGKIARLYTNDGSGNFITRLSFAGVRNSSIAFADVDGDGDQDVLITGDADNGLITKLYTNDGLGNFTEKTGTPFTGVENGSIAFADVDGDNDQDVLITGDEGTSFLPDPPDLIAKLYINDGSGNFTEKKTGTPFTGVSEGSIAFADVDGDNDPDVLITGNEGTSFRPDPIAKLYTNDGKGNFTAGLSFAGVSSGSIAFADVDGDNDPDVLITGNSTARLYTNDGSGSFTEKTEGIPFEGVSSSSIAFADVDGDKDQDVLITGDDGLSNAIARLYINNGLGNFTEQAGTPFTGVLNSSIAFADVDKDGDFDVLISGNVQRRIPGRVVDLGLIATLYTNDGKGNFTEKEGTPFTGVRNSSIAFADVDGDNDQDVLITGSIRFGITHLYTNDGKGTFSRKFPPVFETPPFEGVSGYSNTRSSTLSNSFTAFADVDGDNDQDVLITGLSNSGRTARLYTNDGSGNFTEKTEGTSFEGVSAGSIAFADVDGDNDQDVLITGYAGLDDDNNAIRIAKLYNNDGSGSFTEKTTGTPFTGISESSIAFADVDGDNDPDVLITGNARVNDSFRIIAKLYTNDGSGNFTEKATGTPFEGRSSGSIAFADIDGDNDPDVLITGSSRGGDGGITRLYTNDGSGNFTKKTVGIPFTKTFRSVAFADVDGDNDQDVLVTGSALFESATAKLYTNDGKGNFIEKAETLFEGVLFSSVAFADADGDNDQDVLITGRSNSGPIAKLYTNDGRGNFIEQTGMPLRGVSAGSIAFADVDGDSDQDVLITGVSNSANPTLTALLYINEKIPVFASGSSAAAEVPENTTAVLTITTTNSDSEMITYTISAGADSSRFSINQNTGVLTFKTAPDHENPADRNGNNIYKVIITANNGENEVSQIITVTVMDVNDNDPVITSDATVNVVENTTDALTVTATDADSGAVIMYSISGGADGALFAIGETSGALTFITAPDFEGASADGDDDYEVIVTASDGDNSVMQTITVTVTDLNDNDPIITSEATASIAENTTDVLTVTATDADIGTTLMYAISGGADGALFAIDASSGVLTFITAPDFEMPSDQGSDNDYEVIVTASDGTNSDTQIITVTVTNDPADDILGLPAAEGVRLYPNPASDYFTLKGTSEPLRRVSLVSTAGNMVRTYPASQDGVYDTSGLSEGIFFVILEGTEGRQQAGRIVIRK